MKPRELARRSTDQIDVTLLWWPDTDRLTVKVSDAEADAEFEFELGPDDRPLDAFLHPFSFASGGASAMPHRVPDYGMARA